MFKEIEDLWQVTENKAENGTPLGEDTKILMSEETEGLLQGEKMSEDIEGK